MANQLNFPDKLSNTQDQRPSRLAQKDAQLIQADAEKEIVFGQTTRDVAEIYIYDELNRLVNHTNVRPGDPTMRLLTFSPDQAQVGIGQDSTPDNLQIDLVTVLNRLNEGKGLPPGRYSVSLNFFRDEVGQEFVSDAAPESLRKAGGRLYIADISPSRTELRLGSVIPTVDLLNDIREFAVPAVPRVDAQALVDQTFGTALSIQQGKSITVASVEDKLIELDAAGNTTDSFVTTSRLTRASLNAPFASFVLQALPNIRDAVLNEIAARVGDLELQQNELQAIIEDTTFTVLQQMVRAGALHPKLQLTDINGAPVQ